MSIGIRARTRVAIGCLTIMVLLSEAQVARAGSATETGAWTAATPQTTEVPSIPVTLQTTFTLYNGGTFNYTLDTFYVGTTGTYSFSINTTGVVNTSWYLTGTFAPSDTTPTTPISNFLREFTPEARFRIRIPIASH